MILTKYAMGHWNRRAFYALFGAKIEAKGRGIRITEKDDQNHGDVE